MNMKLLINILGCAVTWPLLFVSRTVMVLLGLAVVPIALIYRRVVPSERDASWAGWRLVRLPWWAWPWDNLRDGAMGDVRGTYWFTQAPKWADTPREKMFNWLALRNPCNNFSRFFPLLAVHMVGKTVECLAGTDATVSLSAPGFQFCRLVGYPAWGLYYVSSFALFGRRLKVRLGHKIEPRHNFESWDDVQKAQKGITFTVSLKGV